MWIKPKHTSTIHYQRIRRNHLLSQVVQPLLTTTLTQLIDLLRKRHQVSFHFSVLKGLTFVYYRFTYVLFVFLSYLRYKDTFSFHAFAEYLSTSQSKWKMSPCPQQCKFLSLYSVAKVKPFRIYRFTHY